MICDRKMGVIMPDTLLYSMVICLSILQYSLLVSIELDCITCMFYSHAMLCSIENYVGYEAYRFMLYHDYMALQFDTAYQ